MLFKVTLSLLSKSDFSTQEIILYLHFPREPHMGLGNIPLVSQKPLKNLLSCSLDIHYCSLTFLIKVHVTHKMEEISFVLSKS